MKEKVKVALVGNPNTGKSSLFNILTGLNQKIGNYPGITVDKKKGYFRIEDKQYELLDLPGSYSLYPKAKDDEVVLEILVNKHHQDHPDVILFLIDATNLKRNLLFLSQVRDLGIPVIVIMNMMDMLEKTGNEIDIKNLSTKLKLPVIAFNARKVKGIDNLEQVLYNYKYQEPEVFVNISEFDPGLLEEIKDKKYVGSDYGAYQLAVLKLRKNKLVGLNGDAKSVQEEIKKRLIKIQGEDILARYKKIDEITESCFKEASNKNGRTSDDTQKIDKVLTHGIWGYLTFFTVMFIIFQALFHFASFPMDLIEIGFGKAQYWISETFPKNLVTDLLANGIIPGVGGIVVFVPQIALLFGFLSILEDTGYMARVSFLMDRIMSGVGMNGKSIVPLVGSLACAVPSIMAARTIQNPKERLITVLVSPFMSCSARLPIYVLLIGMVVPNRMIWGVISFQGLALLAMYLAGAFMAMLVSWVMHFFIKGNERTSFFLELPKYQWPRWHNVLISMYQKSKLFVVSAGKIIMIIAIILWGLASFGPRDMALVEKEFIERSPVEQYSPEEFKHLISSEKLANSYAGYIGKIIEPVIRPLGFDWKIGIALITSFAAREIFVGTMATLYSAGSESEDNFMTIRQKMLSDVNITTGAKVFSFATIISLLFFYAFAMQCMSTFAIVKRETNSWKWPVFQLVMMTILAYIISFAAFSFLS